MNISIWDCELAQAGVSLSNFQREMMADAYNGRTRMTHGARLAADGRGPRTAGIVMRRLAGVALVSALAMSPWVGSIYASL